MDPARKGKIARLPHALREAVNQRLLDGEKSSTLLAWLNSQPEAIRLWEADYEGMPASAENLSQWRLGGYRDWIARRERSEHLKTLADYSLRIAKSGGDIADGVASIVAGHLLEALESLADAQAAEDEGKSPIDSLIAAAEALSFIRQGNIARERLALDKKRVRQKDKALDLDREKFEVQTVRKFIEWARSPEAAAILDSGKPRHAVMADLRSLLFGTSPVRTS